MADWLVAESLTRVRRQLNAAAPNRSTAADGTIGDAAHQKAGTSDHLARRIAGALLVTALDVTHDPAGGLDCSRLAAALRIAEDPRVKYVIWQGRIMSGAAGPAPWTWRPYRGPNPHDHHLHLSVVGDARCRDDTPWTLTGLAATSGPGQGTVLKDGDTGELVLRWQVWLNRYLPAAIDLRPRRFGPQTVTATRTFQRRRGLVDDGIAGPKTLAAARAEGFPG